jgi:16S rRNA (uracil1498-N3)-methyltransferase
MSPTDNVVLTGSASHYLARVLRSSQGDSITLFNGDGKNYIGRISEIQAMKVMIRIVESQFPDNESFLKVTLVQAITRGERMDYTLQKATELGVFGIQPVTSQRVEVRLTESRLASRPLSLARWLSVPDDSPRWVLDPLANDKMSIMARPEEAVSVLVGPEGGFSTEELDQLRDAGVKPVSLGPRVLRTETAGPAALAVLQALAGDI